MRSAMLPAASSTSNPAARWASGSERDDGKRGHPCPVLAPGEAGREPHERDAGGERERPGEVAGCHWQHGLEEVEPVGQRGRDRREDVDETDDQRPERDDDRGLDGNRREPAQHLPPTVATGS